MGVVEKKAKGPGQGYLALGVWLSMMAFAIAVTVWSGESAWLLIGLYWLGVCIRNGLDAVYAAREKEEEKADGTDGKGT